MTLTAFLPLVVIGLAGARLARLVSDDSITDPLRAWVWHRAFTEAGEWAEDGRPRIITKDNRWRWLWIFADCPFCTGAWITAALWAAWTYWHAGFVRPVIACAAAVGIQAVLSAKGGD